MSEIPRELLAALVPVLQDLESTCPRVPRIEPHEWGMDDQLSAMAWWPDDGGQGIFVLASDSSDDRIAAVADQLQELVVENLPGIGHQAVWPECPEHPRSHPLQATVRDGLAVWVCPRSDLVVDSIGGLRR